MKNRSTENFKHGIAKPMLCDGFLIPMTDFVNNVGNMENYPSHENALSWIYNYATFLKQPLKLEMFVPCDDEGIVLAEPKNPHTFASENSDDYIKKWKSEIEIYNKVYNKAKEKVLFEGFEQYKDYECAKYEDVYVDEEVCDGKFTVEDLIKDVGKTKIKLSQTAFDTIFGKTVA